MAADGRRAGCEDRNRLPPETVDADVLDGDATAAALCAALESGAPIPDDIVVSSPILEIALEPLAVKLGAKLVRQKHTPAVDEFRDVLTEKMLRRVPTVKA